MIPSSVFASAAKVELLEASAFYEQTSPGLGDAFLGEVEYALDQIRAHPALGGVILGTVRKIDLRKFPYALMYSFRQGELRILAVAHHSRTSLYWRSRVRF